MKIIKKIFTLLLIIPLISFCFVGCKNNKESPETTPTNTPTEPEWVEVYRISYRNTSNYEITLTSSFEFKLTTTEIIKEEFFTLEDYSSSSFSSKYGYMGNFYKSTSSTFEYIERLMNAKYKYMDRPEWYGTENEPYIKYYKQDNQRDLVLNYISVQILGENYFKYKYKGEEKLIYTTSFEVEYFTE